MKKLFLTLAISLFAFSANAADKYVFDKNHTNILWSGNHFGYSSPFGYFTDFDGTIVLDEQDPTKSTVDVTIKTASLTTPIPKFTEHLKSKDFFNVETYPEAKFVSTKVEKTGENTARITGNFTLLGQTKPLVLEVRLNKIGKHPFTQKHTAGFSAGGIIKRGDYGMSYGAPGVGNDVKLTIETELVKADEAAATAE